MTKPRCSTFVVSVAGNVPGQAEVFPQAPLVPRRLGREALVEVRSRGPRGGASGFVAWWWCLGACCLEHCLRQQPFGVVEEETHVSRQGVRQ